MLEATTAEDTAPIGAQEPVITIIDANLITHVDDLFSAAVLKHGLEIDKMKVSDFHRAMAERIRGALDKKAKRAIKGRLTELMMDPQQRNVADEIGLIFKLDGKEGKETKVCLRDMGSYVKFTSECYRKGFKSGTDYTNLSAQLFAAPKGSRQEQAAATLINNNPAFRDGKLEGEQLEILRTISKHIRENWDDPKIYMKKAYDPPRLFQDRKVNKEKTQKITNFTNLTHVKKLIKIFEDADKNLWVMEVWFLKKKDEGDGFENYHYDYKASKGGTNDVSVTVNVNLGKWLHASNKKGSEDKTMDDDDNNNNNNDDDKDKDKNNNDNDDNDDDNDNKLLRRKLAPFGYVECENTPGLSRHETRPISFTLVVDNFGVKYVNKEDVDHLIASIKTIYSLTEDWTENLCCGIALEWNYKNGHVDISMPGYIRNKLQKYGHTMPKRLQTCPYSPEPKKYGSEAPPPLPPDATPKLDARGVKRIQKIVGSILYYTRAADMTVLMALSSIAMEQTKATERTVARCTQLLGYLAGQADAKVGYHTSDMIMNIHSDASYLSEEKACSRTCGHFPLGWVPKNCKPI